jgi:hypothetical protein
MDRGDVNSLVMTAVVVAVLIGAGILILKKQRKPYSLLVRSNAARIEEFRTARLGDRLTAAEDLLAAQGKYIAVLEAAIVAMGEAAGKTPPPDLMTTQPQLKAIRGG